MMMRVYNQHFKKRTSALTPPPNLKMLIIMDEPKIVLKVAIFTTFSFCLGKGKVKPYNISWETASCNESCSLHLCGRFSKLLYISANPRRFIKIYRSLF